MNRARPFLGATLALAAAASAQSFQPLGPTVIPFGLSADGSVVVGRHFASNSAIRWTEAGGVQVIASGNPAIAHSTSADGSVVVGMSAVANVPRPWRWTAAGGLQFLGGIGGGAEWGGAYAVSADGSVVTGNSIQPFRWTAQTGMVGLGLLPGGDYGSGRAITPDGQVIVGDSNGTAGRQAFRWTEATGMVALGDLPGGTVDSGAQAVSADGTVIGGYATTAAGFVPALWREGSGWTHLGTLPGVGPRGQVTGLSAAGDVAVGFVETPGSGQPVPFLWNPHHGMRPMTDVLQSVGLNLDGWVLDTVWAITPDGLTFAGHGLRNGSSHGWVATIPAPATLPIFACGLLAIRRRR